jgi:hypothetical protein
MTSVAEISSDFVWGAERIADFFRNTCGIQNANAKMIYNWYERGGAIPISKSPHNGKLFISRSAVLAHLTRQVDAALARCAVIPGETPTTTPQRAAALHRQRERTRSSGQAVPTAKGGRQPGRRGPRGNFRGR